MCSNTAGHIDATSIKEYLGIGGYRAFETALFDMDGEEIVQMISDSNLRGRGGRRLPDRTQVEPGAPPEGCEQVYSLQRRRGRPRRLHGPLYNGGRPAPYARRHDDSGARLRRGERIYLRARRVPDGGLAPAHGHRAGGGVRPCSEIISWAAASRSASTSTAAREPSSAAKAAR